MSSLISEHPAFVFILVVSVAILISPFVQKLVGSIALKIAIKTETVVDDLITKVLETSGLNMHSDESEAMAAFK